MNGSLERLELDKILKSVASYAVLEDTKEALLLRTPAVTLGEAKERLLFTEEANLLLFSLGAGRVEYYPPQGDALERAEKGATLSCTELIASARLLRSARVCYTSVNTFSDERIPRLKELTARLIFNAELEREIGEKILSEEEIADTASDKLFTIRREIRLLNERIRARLSSYLSGEEKKYLQEGIVTVRGDRFVIPVKAEYKRSIRGFVHDRSQTGATVFIEPEEVLEMNNELKNLRLDEREEIERILLELSHRVGALRSALEADMAVLSEVDAAYACAEYGYRVKGVKPILNGGGVVDIVKGRHPLLDERTAVPVSVSVGGKYSFLLISGANTGGKTVTLKMCGLFCLMAACGLFVPAAEGTRLAVFDGVYCDVGDSQSIEENLSTFSSHVVRLKEILKEAGKNSFVLIDEPGGGTDPEEGQALARAVLNALLKKGCRGIVTTHYSALKEFAYATKGLMNGCMEFDERDYRPLYRLRIGAPGSSNALAICTRLGLPAETIEEARGYLSEGARTFERTVRSAEESRIRAEEIRAEAETLKKQWEERLTTLELDEEKLRREREKFFTASKAEARRIVNERTARAEELLEEIEDLFKKETLTEADLIRARTLKNKMQAAQEREEEQVRSVPVDPKTLKVGDRVLVGSMNAEGVVLTMKSEKRTAEVQVGSLRVRSKFSDLFCPRKAEEKQSVQVVRNLNPRPMPKKECNLLGLTVSEAIPEVEELLDGAVLSGLSEVRIVHGMGTGKLRAAIAEFLRKDARVEEFRLGKYGEGESGVTIVKLK